MNPCQCRRNNIFCVHYLWSRSLWYGPLIAMDDVKVRWPPCRGNNVEVMQIKSIPIWFEPHFIPNGISNNTTYTLIQLNIILQEIDHEYRFVCHTNNSYGFTLGIKLITIVARFINTNTNLTSNHLGTTCGDDLEFSCKERSILLYIFKLGMP